VRRFRRNNSREQRSDQAVRPIVRNRDVILEYLWCWERSEKDGWPL